MKRHSIAAIALGLLLPLGAIAEPDQPAATRPATQPATLPSATQKADAAYTVTSAIQIPGEGGWDPWSSTPVTLDSEGKLLYVSRASRTQVIEAATAKVVAEINSGPGASPGAIALVPDVGRGFITNSHDNAVTVFDLKTNVVLGRVPVEGVPSSIVYDAKSKRVLVGCDPDSLVPIPPDIDLKTGKPDGAIVLDGSPRGLVSDGQGMVYVSIYDQDEVAVIDTRTMKLATCWPTDAWSRPVGISMDRLRNRLFVGCRSRVVVLSAVDGHQLGEVKVGGPDAWVTQGAVTFHEGKVFTNCGEGILAVLGQNAAGAFEVEQRAQIPRAGWSMALDPKTETFYLPVSDPGPGPERRWGSGIKLVVVGKK